MNGLLAGRVRFSGIAALALLAGLLPAGITPAAAAFDAEATRTACMHDAFRLCTETMPDVARTKQCLLLHRVSLSPECRAGFSGGGGRRGTHHTRHHH
jgi:hypothetical protein